MEELSKAVQKWEKKYSTNRNVFGLEPNDFLKTNLHYFQKTTGTLLVPGDGDGRNGIWLAGQGFKIEANDGAPSAVKNALERSKAEGTQHNYKTTVQELTDWTISGSSYQGVILLHVHFETEDRKKLYRKLINSLKPEGIILIEIFHPDNIENGVAGPQTPDLCVTPEDMEETFEALDIIQCGIFEKQVKPTEFHEGGIGYVTRLIACKK